MKHDQVKAHWESWARDYGTDLRATTRTPTIKSLEIQALARAFTASGLDEHASGEVLEVGCGNGYNCIALAARFPGLRFTGVDYVAGMVESARRLAAEGDRDVDRVSFRVGDVLALSEDAGLADHYDVVFTDRCIINLGRPERQEQAITQLAAKVRPGGALVLIENVRQVYDRQNACRVAVDLPAREPAPFNRFLDEPRLLEWAEAYFERVLTDDFASLHDLVLYVLLPMANGGVVEYDHPLVEAVTKLTLSLPDELRDDFGRLGQNRLYLFRRRV